MNQVATVEKNLAEKILLTGDVSGLTQEQLFQYYTALCERLGLDPLTQPFNALVLKGRKVLYATRAASEQLRKINGVSIIDLQSKNEGGIYTVTVKVQDKDGRTDISSGAVSIEGKKGEDLANAYLKAETKAKRRATLSICGLGMMDETEAETIREPEPEKTAKKPEPTTPENVKKPSLKPSETPRKENDPSGVNPDYLQQAKNYLINCGVPEADIRATVRLVCKRQKSIAKNELTQQELDEVLKRVKKMADLKAEQEKAHPMDRLIEEAGFIDTPVNAVDPDEIPLPYAV